MVALGVVPPKEDYGSFSKLPYEFMAIQSRDILQISRNAAGGIAREYRPLSSHLPTAKTWVYEEGGRLYGPPRFVKLSVKKWRTKQDMFSALAAHLPLRGQCNGKL